MAARPVISRRSASPTELPGAVVTPAVYRLSPSSREFFGSRSLDPDVGGQRCLDEGERHRGVVDRDPARGAAGGEREPRARGTG